MAKRNGTTRSTSRTLKRRPRQEIKEVLRRAFRREFPEDTIDISDGYKENIHVMVVSRRFDEMNERVKQDCMWTVIDGTDLSKDEKLLISLIYPISPAEIK